MDVILLLGIAIALLAIIITLFFMQKKTQKSATPQQQQQQQARVAAQRAVPVRAAEAVPRRAQIARNQRNRLRAATAEAQAEAEAAHDDAADNANADEAAGSMPTGAKLDEKWGAKKRAKEEAKEQKRLQREHELKEREERKLKEAKQDEERKQQEQLAEEQERKQLEKQRLEREERERKEHEEYLKMKQAFSVEEEGYEEDTTEQANMLSDFVRYIKDNKVVLLEDLAVEFKLKTQQAIERIQELQANGSITGVIDDRGKFIYISEEELAAVAKFIKQRGRVSITELAESSNKLINLTPVTSAL